MCREWSNRNGLGQKRPGSVALIRSRSGLVVDPAACAPTVTDSAPTPIPARPDPVAWRNRVAETGVWFAYVEVTSQYRRLCGSAPSAPQRAPSAPPVSAGQSQRATIRQMCDVPDAPNVTRSVHRRVQLGGPRLNVARWARHPISGTVSAGQTQRATSAPRGYPESRISAGQTQRATIGGGVARWERVVSREVFRWLCAFRLVWRGGSCSNRQVRSVS